MNISNQSFIVIVKSKQKHYLTLIEVEIDIFFDIDNVMDAKICPEIDIDPFFVKQGSVCNSCNVFPCCYIFSI